MSKEKKYALALLDAMMGFMVVWITNGSLDHLTRTYKVHRNMLVEMEEEDAGKSRES